MTEFTGAARYEELAARSIWTPEEFSELEHLEELREAAARKYILALRAKGMVIRQISAHLGIAVYHVRKALASPKAVAPQEDKQARSKPPVKRVPHARAEARVFAHMVQSGQMTEEQAEGDIGIGSADRAALEAFARTRGGATAKMVQAALRLREQTLLAFREACR